MLKPWACLKRLKESIQFRSNFYREKILSKLITVFPYLRSYLRLPVGSLDSLSLFQNSQRLISDLETILPTKTYQVNYQSQYLTQDPTRSWFQLNQKVTTPPKIICKIPNGYIFGDSGAILTADHKLLSDLSLDFNLVSQSLDISHHYIFQKTRLPQATFIPGRVASCVAPAGGNNYFHWMIDVLPKLYLLQKSSISWQDIDYWAFNELKFPFCYETLTQFQVPLDRIVKVSSETYIQASNLICTSPPSISNQGRTPVSAWIINFLRTQFLSTQDNHNQREVPKRIWISRLDSSRRSIANEFEIMSLLESLGFISVTLSTLSVQEQASLFNQAETIVAAHGAGLTNLVFCNPGTKVVEIFLPPHPNGQWSGIGDYCYLSNQLDLPYFYMVSDELDEIENPESWNNRRMLIDPEKLLKVFALTKII